MSEPDKLVEQFIISGSVWRQRDKLPKELVVEHLGFLRSVGIAGQGLRMLSAIPTEGWLDLIDRLQSQKDK